MRLLELGRRLRRNRLVALGADPRVATAVADARRSLSAAPREDDGPLALIARRVLIPQDRSVRGAEALAAWFGSPVAELGEILEARSARQLVEAAGVRHRPRALELHDLLLAVEGTPPSPTGSAREFWVVLDRGGTGEAVRLRVQRVTGGEPGLAADPAWHAFSVRDVRYRRAEGTASAIVRDVAPSAALRYALVRDNETPYLDAIKDGSLGAPLAVLGLAAVQSDPLRGVDRHCSVTGIVATDATIGPVDPAGLRGKVVAAQTARVRRLVVPVGQASMLPGLGGMRACEAATIRDALRSVRVLRRSVRAAMLGTVAVAVVAAPVVRAIQSSAVSRQERRLAALRAMAAAHERVDDDPRMALGLAAAAANLNNPGTEVSRAMLAARLPPGIRYLPDLRDAPEAVAAVGGQTRILTARKLLMHKARSAEWRVLAKVPEHEVGGLTTDGWPVIAGRRGAVLIEPGTNKRTTITRDPVRSIATGRATAAALTSRGRLLLLIAGTPVHEIAAPRDLTAIAISETNRLYAIDGRRRILRSTNGRMVPWVAGSSGPEVKSLAVRGDGAVAITASGHSINLTVPQYGTTATDGRVTLSLGQSRRVVVGAGAVEVLADPRDFPVPRVEQRLPGRFRTAALSLDGRRIVVAGKTVALIDAHAGLTAPTGDLGDGIVFGDDGGLLTINSSTATLYRLRAGAEPTTRDAPLRIGGPVQVSPNRRWAAQVTWPATIRAWDLVARTRREISVGEATLDTSGNVNFWLAPLDDGGLVFSRNGATYKVYPKSPSVARATFEFATDRAKAAGSSMVVLARDDRATLVRARDLGRLAEIRLPHERVMRIAASADGARIFLGTEAGEVWMWEPKSGSRQRLARLGSSILALASRADGALLAAYASDGLRDGSNVLIDVNRRQSVGSTFPQIGLTFSVALSADGRKVAWAGPEPTAVNVRSLRLTGAQACAALGRAKIPVAVWQEAIGDLHVTLPSCPRSHSRR